MEVRQNTVAEKSATSDRMNLILFVAGKFVSLFGTQIYSFAIGLYVLEKTNSGLSFARPNSKYFKCVISIILPPTHKT